MTHYHLRRRRHRRSDGRVPREGRRGRAPGGQGRRARRRHQPARPQDHRRRRAHGARARLSARRAARPARADLLAVKSQDTDAALDVLAPLVGPDTVVVSLQNGMNPPRIAARIGADKVVAAFINFGADWQGPGHIEHGGPGAIYIGEIDGRKTERLDRIQALLVEAHDRAHHRRHLQLSLGQADRLLAALRPGGHRRDHGRRVRQPAVSAGADRAGRRGARGGAAAGITPRGFDGFDPLAMRPRTEAEVAEARAVLDRFAAYNRGLVKVRSGPWRDMAVRKRRRRSTTCRLGDRRGARPRHRAAAQRAAGRPGEGDRAGRAAAGTAQPRRARDGVERPSMDPGLGLDRRRATASRPGCRGSGEIEGAA